MGCSYKGEIDKCQKDSIEIIIACESIAKSFDTADTAKNASQLDCAVCTTIYQGSKDFCDCFLVGLPVYNQTPPPKPLFRHI